ncbi:uncharacterized protein LTHEOB_12447 [Lasiodiplodia theobromae]|uniref:uncharacterized protein n=1 Tax=Lasiodiplodia theobromae TaxID=45133 RepID=UPI0015C36CFB|nr:uncharacterized protein LTHEOB_12447 [Lasiodiplodia theobromae]KAF4535921.1 hypothetical protein LTHEOB_12447 [Lasiodiplodia theobromae]
MAEIGSLSNAPSLQEFLHAFAERIRPLDEAKILYEGGEKCDCCINWTETYPEDVKESFERTTQSRRYPIIIRLQKSHTESKRSLQLHSIVIQSAELKAVLGEVFVDYPGITTTLEELNFSKPFWEFFYRWDALVNQVEQQQDPESRKHTQLLIKTLSSQLDDIHSTARDLAQNNVITFDYLWTLFPPGTLLYSCQNAEDRFVELVRAEYVETMGMKSLNLSCKYVDWDGKAFGWKNEDIKISFFSGTLPIHDLEVYPAMYHKEEQSLRSRLLERGRVFVSLAGCHHKAYRDTTKSSDKDPASNENYYAEERVIIDAESGGAPPLKPADNEGNPLRVEDFSNNLFRLCSPTVRAYGLRCRQWLAEEIHAPLYVVSAGELGISTHSVERKLEEIFEQAYKWNAVLLLDDSDLYLEKRTPDHLERSQLVSVFTRMLEYYRGLMFLTTSRVASFDVAFESRIDLMLHLEDLDLKSRRRVWTLLLGQVVPPPNITEKDLDTVAEKTINGRQIKAAVKNAQLLAADKEVVLDFSHIEIVLKAMFPTIAIAPDLPLGDATYTQQATPASAKYSSLNLRRQDGAPGSDSVLPPSKRARVS